ncbi:MAG TPA: hypothetical protein VFJ30_01460 [Phycisphaerae bacterium]|nr:hypothetical protein [Phycisphaerae bacterium]
MRRLLISLALPAVLAAGCGGDTFTPGATPSANRIWPTPDPKAEPDEDQYTVLLCVMSDPVSHVRDAQRYEKALTGQLGWKGVFCLHKDGRSEVYWGRFPTPDGAEKTLKAAKDYRAQDRTAVFAQAMIVPLPGKDLGPAEWDLAAAKGTYTVLVAVFRDDPAKKVFGRRGRAVSYCRRLRDAGLEGYYWHGKVSSHVTIGSFTESSLRVERTPQGTRTVITDPRILQIQNDFPMLAINGYGENIVTRDRRTGKINRIPRKTYLARIPRDGEGNDPAAEDPVGFSQPW